MAIKLGIMVDGSGELKTLADNLTKVSAAMEKTQKTSEASSTSSTKSAKATKILGQSAEGAALALESLQTAQEALTRVSSPFINMSKDLGKLKADIALVNSELRSMNSESSAKLANPQFMGDLNSIQAALHLQQQLNAEVMKQGQLTAELAKIQGGAGQDEDLQKMIVNLKEAEKLTGQLITKRKSLLTVEEQSSARMSLAGQKDQAIMSNIKAIDAQRQAYIKLNEAEAQNLSAARMSLAGQKDQAILGNIKALDAQRQAYIKLNEAQTANIASARMALAGQKDQAIASNIKSLDAQRQAYIKLNAAQAANIASAKMALAGQRDQAIMSNIKALEAQRQAYIKLNEAQAQNIASARMSLAGQRDQAISSNIKSIDAQRQAYIKLNAEALNSQRTSGIKANITALKQQEAQAKSTIRQLASVRSSLSNFKPGQVVDQGALRNVGREYASLIKQFNATGEVGGRQFERIQRHIRGLDTDMRRSGTASIDWGKNMKYAMGGVARSMGAMTYSYASLAPLLAGIAVGSAIKNVYKLGAAFEYTTTYVDSLRKASEGLNKVLGETPEGSKGITLPEVDSTAKQLLEMKTMRRTPQEMAEGMKEFAKAGVEYATAIKEIGEMTEFSVIAEMDLNKAITLVIGQSHAFGKSFSETANMIAAAAFSSSTSIEEMAAAMAYTTELGLAAGSTFEEIAGSLGIMANAGVRGTKAAMALRTAILKIQDPTDKVNKMLEKAGVNWSAFMDEGKVKSYSQMFTELRRITDMMTPKDRSNFMTEMFDKRALKAAAALMRAQGPELDDAIKKVQSTLDGVKKGYSFINEVYEDLEETTMGKMDLLAAEFQKSLIKAFDSKSAKEALDTLKDTVASEDFINSVRATIGAIDKLMVSIASLIAVANKIPGDMIEHGLLTVMLFGMGGPATWIAGVLLALKEVEKVGGFLQGVIEKSHEEHSGPVMRSSRPPTREEWEKKKQDVYGVTPPMNAEEQQYAEKAAADTAHAVSSLKELQHAIRSTPSMEAKGVKEYAIEVGFLESRLVDMNNAVAKQKALGISKGGITANAADIATLQNTAKVMREIIALKQEERESAVVLATSPSSGPTTKADAMKDIIRIDKEIKEHQQKLATGDVSRIELATRTSETLRKIEAETSKIQIGLIQDTFVQQQETIKAETQDKLYNIQQGSDEYVAIMAQQNEKLRVLRITNARDEEAVQIDLQAKILELQGRSAAAAAIRLQRESEQFKNAHGSNTASTGLFDKYALEEQKKADREKIKSTRDLQAKVLESAGYTRDAKRILLQQEVEDMRWASTEINGSAELISAYYATELKKIESSSEITSEVMKDAFAGWASGFAGDLNDVLWSAEMSFGNIAESFAKMITEMIIQMKVIKPIMEGLFGNGTAGSTGFMDVILSGVSGMFGGGVSSSGFSGVAPPKMGGYGFAKGGAMSSHGLSEYSNSIVTRPTFFAKGGNVMGEAGPEGILPLSRTSSGNLGVEASGLGGGSVTNVVIYNNSNATATSSETKNSTGGMDIEIIIDQIVGKKMQQAGSQANKSLYAVTGAPRQLTRR